MCPQTHHCFIAVLLALSCGGHLSDAEDGGADLSDILLLFHRPSEPVLTPRGLYRDAIFDVPTSYLPDRFRKVAKQISASNENNGDIKRIPIKEYSMPQSLLNTTNTLPFRAKYSMTNPQYANITWRFYDLFMEAESIDKLLSTGVWARLNFNPEMVLDALRLALLDREDTQSLQLPEFTQYHLDHFVDDGFFYKAREEMWMIQDPEQRLAIPVIRNSTAEANDEDLLWFFREDPGLSLFHRHWHIRFPNSGPRSRVQRDRRGELFAYFHRQLLARYNANRFSLKMEPVETLNFREPLRDGYVPHMTMLHSSTCFADRQPNTTLQAPQIPQIENWIAAMRTAIRSHTAVTPSGVRVNLDGEDGIDILGDTLEASQLLSVNYELYGNIHNSLHGVVGRAEDPLNLFSEPSTIIVTLYSLRDPAFYNIHKLVDDLFEEYKLTLPPYRRRELEFPEIQLKSLEIQTARSKTANELRTFWMESDLDVSLGMEYTGAGPLMARFQRLAHEPFQYKIQVQNTGSYVKEGMVRIFLLLQSGGDGRPLDLRSVQRWSLEMDRFKVTLKPGTNLITRKSTASSVSVDPDNIYEFGKSLDSIRSKNHCRCGLPLSNLLPRGTPEGYRVTFFAMVTDYEEDGIDPSEDEVCRDGWSLCGVPGNQPYPDRKPMGFPFDRRFSSKVTSIGSFLTENMALRNVVIKFYNNTVQSPSPILASGLSTSWKASPVY